MRFAKLIGIISCLVVASALPCTAQNLQWSWANPKPHGNNVVGMAWNGNLGVQVCELGQIYTSPDLVNWLPQNSNLTNDLEAVTFFNNRIIVAGAAGAFAYSDDGVNFTASSLHTTNWIVSLAASSNLVVAVGDNGALYTSTDGAIWHLQAPPPFLFPYWLLSVAYGGGTFVTTGEQGYVATSSNGTNWTENSIDESYGQLESVAWVDGSGFKTVFPFKGFWTVSDAGYALYSTTKGATWTQFNLGSDPSTNVLFTIAADDSTGLLAGDSEVRLGSVNSNYVVWSNELGPGLTNVPPWTYFAAARDSSGSYKLAGADGMLVESSQLLGNYIWDAPYDSPRDWLFQVTEANGLYVAVGDNVRIMTSGDGADWTVEEVPLTNSVSLSDTTLLCVGGTTNFLVAAGSKGSLTVSPNVLVPVVQTNDEGLLITNNASTLGVIWYSLPPPAGTTNDLAGTCAFDNTFFIVGGNGTILSSPDGTNWSRVPSGTTKYLSGIAALTNGLLAVTGDDGTILTSLDGTNWTNRVSGTKNWIYRLCCVNGMLLGVGENGTIVTSTDGGNWTLPHSGVTNWLNDAVMVSNTCYIVGNQGVVLESTNFVDWTASTGITLNSLDGAASQNGQLIAVGFEGSILRSQVYPITTPVNFVSYGQSDGYNIFSVAGVVGQQFTLDSSTNLTSWITGPKLDLIFGDGTLIFYEAEPPSPPQSQFFRCTLAQ